MKYFMRIVCAVCLIGLMGCSKSAKSTNSVEIWHWMTDRHDAFVELAQRYKDETGINIQFELFAPSEAYTHKIIAAAQANVLPEIYGILDKKTVFARFIKAGYVENLTEEMKADGGVWEQSFFPKALAVNKFEQNNYYGVPSGIYGVPLDVTNIQMLYNRKLLAKAGVMSPPETFDEFLTAINALNRIGIPGFVSGFGELWMVDCFASNLAFNIMGKDKVISTYKGEVSYTDPQWIQLFDTFKQLVDKKALSEGIVTKANKYAEQDFALERAAFSFNGSWCVNVYEDMNPKLQYGVMLPPKVNPQNPMSIWGGAGSSFVVNGNSPNKKVAIDFLKWLSAKEQQAFLSMETKNLPSNREALESIPEVLADFSKAMENTTHPTVWPLIEDPQVSETFTKGIQSIIIGEKTPQQVAQEVQAVKERQVNRK